MIDVQNLISQNRALTEEVKRRIDQLAAINTIAASVSQSLDLNQTLETALTTVLDITSAEAGGISLIDEAAGEVVLRAQKGWIQDFVNKRPMRIPLGKGMSGRVISNDQLIVNNDLDESQELAVPSFHNEQFRSIVMAPMHARGKIVGILSIMSSRPHSFDREVIDVLRVVADTVGVALENARLYERTVERQKQLSAVLHSSADGIIATDQTGRIQLVNQTAEKMLSVEAYDLIGLPLREAPLVQKIRDSLLFAVSERSSESSRAFRASLDNGQVLSVIVSEIHVESQVTQTQTPDGWVIVLQDVTHLHEAEMARTQFIQAAAHDMRNPLGVTMSSLDMLQRMMHNADESVQEVISIAQTGITRIQDLIDNLLNLERIENGGELAREPVDVGELIYEIGATTFPLVSQKQIRFSVDLQPGIPLVDLDRRWITRAIYNYLDNAIKYSPNGSQVTLRLYINNDMLHIEVSDNGPGIAPEAQARLFERFYRTEAAARLPGTGLGLAIVKSVAEKHGGNVYVQSSPGAGTTFGMTLSLATVGA